MIGQRLKAGDEKAQKPLKPNPHSATNATQRNPLHKQALNQRTLPGANQVLGQVLDKLTSARFTLMILFAIVNVAILLESLRSTRWTHVSHVHDALSTSDVAVSALAEVPFRKKGLLRHEHYVCSALLHKR